MTEQTMTEAEAHEVIDQAMRMLLSNERARQIMEGGRALATVRLEMLYRMTYDVIGTVESTIQVAQEILADEETDLSDGARHTLALVTLTNQLMVQALTQAVDGISKTAEDALSAALAESGSAITREEVNEATRVVGTEALAQASIRVQEELQQPAIVGKSDQGGMYL